VPPISSANRREIAKPNPAPSCLRVTDESIRLKSENSRGRFSEAIPIPVSSTEI